MRDFCAVQDVVDAITLILEEGKQTSRDIFNIGSAKGNRIRNEQHRFKMVKAFLTNGHRWIGSSGGMFKLGTTVTGPHSLAQIQALYDVAISR